MVIEFEIDGHRLLYSRDPFLGHSEIRTPDGAVEIDSLNNFSTHFNFDTTATKTVEVYGHQVTVEKVRYQWIGGLLPAKFRIFIDGELAAERSGY